MNDIAFVSFNARPMYWTARPDLGYDRLQPFLSREVLR